MSLLNKIILLLLLLIALIAVCVYTKAELIFNEFTNQAAQVTQAVQPEVEAAALLNEEENQTLPVEEVSQENAEETQLPPEDEILHTVPLNSEEETKKDKETLFLKQQQEPSFETSETSQAQLEEEEKGLEEKKSENIEIPKNKTIQEQINELLANNAIVFQRMSSEIANESKETLEKIAKIVVENPHIKIEIAGHTDAKGDDKFNQMISEQRANSVKNKLVELGVDAKRLMAKGYGKTMPLVPNDEDGYSVINRRVEFNITEE